MKQLSSRLEAVAKGCINLTDNISSHYTPTVIRKNGKIRILHIPDEKMKKVQQNINKIFQSNLPKPAYIHMGYKNCKVLNVIKAHQNSRKIIVLDVKNFYGSVSTEKVFSFLTSVCGLNNDTASIILKLVTYKNVLPIGIPTSNIVSFWACKDVFDEIHDYCANLGYNMTLYADDIVISGDIKNPPQIISKVQKIISKAGFTLNYRKMKIYGKKKRIMNVHINPKGRLSISYALRRSINELKRKTTLTKSEELILRGKLQYSRQFK